MSGEPDTPEVDRRLPLGDEIFFDHIAHFVVDPEAATRALTRVGFAPTPVSIQVNPDPAGGTPRPTGTGNVTTMLERGYVEVLFRTADTPLGRYQGVTDQVAMSRTPGRYRTVLVPRGSCRPQWER